MTPLWATLFNPMPSRLCIIFGGYVMMTPHPVSDDVHAKFICSAIDFEEHAESIRNLRQKAWESVGPVREEVLRGHLMEDLSESHCQRQQDHWIGIWQSLPDPYLTPQARDSRLSKDVYCISWE
jgi:hypothetical protein